MVLIEDYKRAILARFSLIRDEQNAEFLMQPTPARLKKMCIYVWDVLTVADKEVYKRFFMCKEDAELYKKIQNFDIDRFKPLTNFLKGKSELTSLNSLDLLAVLLGLNARPYQKFRQIEGEDPLSFKEGNYEKTKAKGKEGILLGIVILFDGDENGVSLKDIYKYFYKNK